MVKVSWKMLVWKLGLSLWVNSRGVQQECQARVSRKSVKEECLGKSAKKECQAKVSSKIVQQECPVKSPAGVSSKSVKNKSVKKECLGTLHYININITLHYFTLFTLHYITLR